MDTNEIIVSAAGIAAIIFVLWYFFGARTATRAQTAAGGVQEIKVTVKGGYSPDVIVVRAGQPVRLDFYRDETAGCSEEIVLRDFNISRRLPAFQTTPVEFTPQTPGEYTFTCGMGMMRGKLVVEPADPAP